MVPLRLVFNTWLHVALHSRLCRPGPYRPDNMQSVFRGQIRMAAY